MYVILDGLHKIVKTSLSYMTVNNRSKTQRHEKIKTKVQNQQFNYKKWHLAQNTCELESNNLDINEKGLPLLEY